MEPEDQKLSAWSPRFWGAWTAFGFLRTVNLLPWSAQRALAAGIGALVFHVLRIRRHVVMVNLRLCFPEKSEGERRKLARTHFDALALSAFETFASLWAKFETLPPYRIVGREHLEAARAQGRGVILLSGHFTTLGMCARMFAKDLGLGWFYRNVNNPVIARLYARQLPSIVTIAVKFDDLRGLVRALKAGHTMWYAPDQGRQTKLSRVLPFFGVPANTNIATSHLATMTRAPVVPYFPLRLADGSYELRILPALENFPSDDVEADAVCVNKLLEDHIRLVPEQYLWVHKRFKRRGPEFPEVY